MKIKMQNKRQLNKWLMIGAVLILMVGLPFSVWAVNSWNGLLTSTYDYTQFENTTMFYEGPLVDGVATEGRYASIDSNTTIPTVTVETPVWDTSLDWDQVTITSTGPDVSLIFNLNLTVDDLLGSSAEAIRIKVNCTKSVTVSVYLVKYDGVDLTSILAYTGDILNTSTTNEVLYTIQPVDLIDLKTQLNKELTDETYYQVIIEGQDTTKLTTGDVVQFQIAQKDPDNAYVYKHETALQWYGSLGGVFFLLLAVGSTDAWNPLTNKPSRSRSKPKKSRSNKRRR